MICCKNVGFVVEIFRMFFNWGRFEKEDYLVRFFLVLPNAFVFLLVNMAYADLVFLQPKT